jgi:hypothetical protein
MSASWALQQAVFALLSADVNIHSLVAARIFDAVPRGAAFPYIVLGEGDETAAGTATEDGREHTIAIHIWSRAGGMRESKRTASAVCVALDRSELTLEGHKLIDLRFASADYTRQSDGETYRAVLRFKAVTEPN